MNIMREIRMTIRRWKGGKGGCPRCGREVDVVGCASAKCIDNAIISGMVDHAPDRLFTRIAYGKGLWHFLDPMTQLGVELRLTGESLFSRRPRRR